MADGEEKRKRFKLPRKMVFAAGGGIFLLLTASAAAAYFMGAADFLLGGGAGVYGAECRLVDQVAFRQDGHERWVRKYISVGNDADGKARLLTAMRVARNTIAAEHADLALVVVLDRNGPRNRALMQGLAVGAKVLYVPHPARVAAADMPIVARYVEGSASANGDFYGKTKKLPLIALEKLMAAMKKPYGCKVPATPAEGASGHGAAKKTSSHH